MVKHYVIMSSSYTKGARIALHLTGEQLEKSKVAALKEKIRGECGDDVSLSSHSFYADSSKWEDVVKHDAFFKKVKVIHSLEEFINLIKADRELLGIDVAKYILSKMKCEHVKLEKLVYFCFADYLIESGERLFTDKIFAFARGPVVESVYEEFKYTTGLLPHSLAKESRIIFAEEGVKKLDCIIKTLGKYGDKSAKELIEITHQEGSPWSKTYVAQKKFIEIPADIISKYHYSQVS